MRQGLEIAWSNGNRNSQEEFLKRLVVDHLTQLTTESVSQVPETLDQQASINILATFLATGRTVILREGSNNGNGFNTSNEVTESQTEQPWRVLHQLRNLGRALARVHGRASITEHEIELLRRVVWSSLPGPRAEALSQFQNHPEGVTVQQCVEGTGKSETWARNILKELSTLDLVRVERPPSGITLYHPAEQYQSLITCPLEELDHIQDLANNG